MDCWQMIYLFYFQLPGWSSLLCRHPRSRWEWAYLCPSLMKHKMIQHQCLSLRKSELKTQYLKPCPPLVLALCRLEDGQKFIMAGEQIFLQSLLIMTQPLRGFLRSAVKDLTVFRAFCFALRLTFFDSIRERQQGSFWGYRRWTVMFLTWHVCKKATTFPLTVIYLFTIMYYIVLQLPSVLFWSAAIWVFWCSGVSGGCRVTSEWPIPYLAITRTRDLAQPS